MKTIILTLTVLLISAGQTLAQQLVPFSGERRVTVLTRNLYAGVDAELAAVPTATDFFDLLMKVGDVYQAYFARNFPERANALAAEIEATVPDLVGLQEAILVRTQFPMDGPATPATDVALDFVAILLDALAARGLHYAVVAESVGFDAELPSIFGIDVRHTDREVILARTDLNVNDLTISNPRTGTFATNCQIPTALIGPITFVRGWASVEAKIRGKSLRLISTHLEVSCLPSTTAIQQAQVAELLTGPAATGVPVVLIGDLNSPGDGSGAAYEDLRTQGFGDAAVAAGLGGRQTCCQAPDLLNPVSMLDTRIDFVLYRGDFTALNAVVVGDDPAIRTPSGFWPSDHAGVAATLRLPQP